MIFQQNTSGQMKNIRAKIKSKTYPEDDTTIDALITQGNDKGFSYVLYQHIRGPGKIIQMKLLKCLKVKSNIERTFMLPTDKSSINVLQLKVFYYCIV